MSTTDDSSDINLLQTKEEEFHLALVILVAEIDAFALQETKSGLLTVENTIPWIKTIKGKASWNALVKITFTKCFQVIYPSRDRRNFE